MLGELSTSLREVVPKALNFSASVSGGLLLAHDQRQNSSQISRGMIFFSSCPHVFCFLLFCFFYLWDAESISDHLQKITFVSLKPPCEGKPQMETKILAMNPVHAIKT